MDNPVSTKAALVQALTEAPGYGKDLIERVKKQTKGAVELGLGSVYPALRSLEGDGLITEASKAGRASLYKLTADGKKAAIKNRKAAAALFGFSA